MINGETFLLGIAFTIAGVAFVCGIIVMLLIFCIPWLWSVLKPIFHALTG